MPTKSVVRHGDLVQDDAEESPRTARGWVISGLVDILGFILIALVLRIWGSWAEALTWSMVAIVGWIGVDIYGDYRRRRRRRVRDA